MRKAITMLIVLSLGVSLWADDVQTLKAKKSTELNESFPPHIDVDHNNRTETYTLFMDDSFGDGWNGASLDLLVNGTVVLDDATVTGGSAQETFDVEVGDVVTTEWTSGAWDSECSYGLYNPNGDLVAEAGTANNPDLTLTYTVVPTPTVPQLIISGVLDLTREAGTSNGKGLVFHAIGDIDDLSIYGFGVANNGGGTDGQEYTFPAQTMAAGENLWVIRNADSYAAYFGDEWANINYIEDSSPTQNGNDAIELFFFLCC